MRLTPARTARQLLCHALEGDVAAMPAHERREQYRRQIHMLHGIMSRLLVALVVVAGLVAAYGLATQPFDGLRLAAQVGAVGTLAWLARRYRGQVSIRRRLTLGVFFLVLLMASLAVPGLEWSGDSLLPLTIFLLLPVMWLPLLVRPYVTFGCLALGSAVVFALLWAVSAPPAERQLLGFYYLLSVGAGLVLRRARSNLAARFDRQVETLWQRAVSDPLTGLLNRQGWMNLAGTAMREALEAGKQPGVLFIDVDHFKRTNDDHGHLAGDELLRALGNIIEARIGPGEYCARLGGEEFACLLPDATPERARRFAERLASDYREHASAFGSTLSIGIALHEPGDVLNDLLARADAALYQAKRTGRDRVVF